MSKHSDQIINKADSSSSKQDSILGLLARVFWMLYGNLIPMISIIVILQHKDSMFHTADLVFWIAIAALILVRYLDVKFWGGMTAAGGPATIANWNRYAVALLISSVGIWALSHVVSYLM